MYSTKNPRDVNVLVSNPAGGSIWEMQLEDRIAISEHKQRAQQHVLKVFKQKRNNKINSHEEQIRTLRKENRRKRKLVEKMLRKSKTLTGEMQTEEQKLFNQKTMNRLKYEKNKLELKLKQSRTYHQYLLRMFEPKRKEEVQDKQTERRCCVIENRLADSDMKSNMALTIAIYYKEIRCKYDKDHPKWPPRIRYLKVKLSELTNDLQFLKRAARLAIGEKSRAVKKYQKMYYHHIKQREERRRQQQDLINHIRSLKDEFVPFPEVKPPEEIFQKQSPRTTYEHCVRALNLQDAFDTMQQNIPGGGDVDTVIERLEIQVKDRNKLKQRVDEVQAEQTKLKQSVKHLSTHRNLLQYGGCDLLHRQEEYVRELRQSIDSDTKTLQVTKKQLQDGAALTTDIRAGFCSILDTIRGGDRLKGEPHPEDIMQVFSNVEEKLMDLMNQARDVRVEDLKEVRRPGFRHFMENELNRTIGDDPVGRILAKKMSGATREQEELEADMDNNIDIEEFRAALKNKSIKLYLSRCNRAKAMRGIPSSMNPQYRPDKESYGSEYLPF